MMCMCDAVSIWSDVCLLLVPRTADVLLMCLRADHKSTAQSPKELMRPYLHEFLISAYVDYDIVIWCKPDVSLSE